MHVVNSFFFWGINSHRIFSKSLFWYNFKRLLFRGSPGPNKWGESIKVFFQLVKEVKTTLILLRKSAFLCLLGTLKESNKIIITITLSGSDQRRSHRSPWSGTSVGLMILRICSMLCRSGDRPPWQQKIFSSTKIIIWKV